MPDSPKNPIATPVVMVSMLLQDLLMTRVASEPEEGEPIHPHNPDDGELLTIEHRLIELLGWRRPADPGEALAMVALAYQELDVATAFEGPMERESFERAYRLLRRALPMLAKAIGPSGLAMAIMEYFAEPAFRDGGDHPQPLAGA